MAKMVDKKNKVDKKSKPEFKKKRLSNFHKNRVGGVHNVEGNGQEKTEKKHFDKNGKVKDAFAVAEVMGSDKKVRKKITQEAKMLECNNFNKNRTGIENDAIDGEEQKEKKPFDKKIYRLKKYSKKYKLDQWEEQRKKKLLRDYHKTLKNDPMVGSYKPVSFDEDTPDSIEVGRFVKHPDLMEQETSTETEAIVQKKKDPFQKAKEHYNKLKQDKLVKQQAIEKAREEKKQKLQEYKKKKHERFKKLSKKTKKGQPVMTGRLELLLEKIQKG